MLVHPFLRAVQKCSFKNWSFNNKKFWTILDFFMAMSGLFTVLNPVQKKINLHFLKSKKFQPLCTFDIEASNINFFPQKYDFSKIFTYQKS